MNNSNKMMTKYSKSIYFLPILLGLGIFLSTLITYSLIVDYQERLSKSHREQISQILDGIVDRRESRIHTISNSMIGFFESSNEVTPSEFASFSTRIFDVNPEFVNVAVIDKNQIIRYSFPNFDLVENNFNNLSSSYPIKINNVDTMNFKFNMDNSDALIVSVPLDYFIPLNSIPGVHFKIILFSPLDDNSILYQISNNNGIVETENIEFTQNELQNSIEVYGITNLYGYAIQQNYVLKYLIWDDTFEIHDTMNFIFLIFGILSSAIVPIIVYKTNYILRQKNYELQEIKKSKDEFVTMIIHDLKNPLVPILSLSDILLSNAFGDLTSKQIDRIKMIKSSAITLENLIRDLLDSQKVELGKLRLNFLENNLSDIIQNTISKLKPEFDTKGVIIDTNIARNILCVCDKMRIEQVISNILFNSLDFVSEKTGHVLVTLESNDHTAKIMIKDNGIGMEKNQLDKLFVKFYQIKNNQTRKYGGTGLGLAVSRDLIILHGGKIWAESDGIGTGSTFFIELPLRSNTFNK